jgi:type VI secretion system secreted protein VgrG
MGTRAAIGAVGGYTQAGRPLVIETTLEGDALILTSFEGEEEVSQPYAYTLELVSTDPAVDARALLRTKARIRMQLPIGETRYIHGRLANVEQLESDGDLTSYRAELVPAHWFLTMSRDSRVFADKTVREIITQIFEEGGLAQGSDYEITLVREPKKQRYAIQYRESPLDFLSRLMEDEGIFYFFVHGEDGAKMVITDANSTAEYGAQTKPVRMSPVEGAAQREEDTIAVLHKLTNARPGKITLADYNFRTPSSRLLTSLAGVDPEEVYDYPARFRDMAEGEKLARVRLEAEEATGEIVRGEGPCRVLAAGMRFDLVEHYRDSMNTTYLVLKVTLAANLTGLRSGEEAGFTFSSSFEAVPFDVPYRPPRVTPRPSIPGVQTATVGPGSEEIIVDKYGRIPIQFHWDRRNKEEEKPSCWARVASPWAGKSWGMVSIPRVGQEVVVHFLEGDPDRPIIIASVYNAEQMPPNGLPGAGMVSGFKSNSTPGGGGYNEISSNDTKGKEKVTIHAQYDMSTTVGHDDTQTITNDRTITVTGKHTETIKKDTAITVSEGKYAHTVATGNSEVKVSTGTHTHTVKGKVTENYDATQDTTVKENIKITSTTAMITIDGKTEIVLVSGDSSISLKADGTIKISGKKIEISGGDEAKIGVGNQNVTCDKTKVGVSGAAINSSAVGTHEIAGALVKIN